MVQAEGLLEGKAAGSILVDKAYDAEGVLQLISRQGAEAVIPPRTNRIVQRSYDTDLYKERNQIERFFNRLKQFRRIATRYEKTDSAFLAMITVAAILIWLR